MLITFEFQVFCVAAAGLIYCLFPLIFQSKNCPKWNLHFVILTLGTFILADCMMLFHNITRALKWLMPTTYLCEGSTEVAPVISEVKTVQFIRIFFFFFCVCGDAVDCIMQGVKVPKLTNPSAVMEATHGAYIVWNLQFF